MGIAEIDRAVLPDCTVLELPTGRDLVTACGIAYGQNRAGEHLVARWVQALAQLHRSCHFEPAKADRIAVLRSNLIVLIDQWAAVHTRLSRTGFGTAADQLTGAYVAARLMVYGDDPADPLDLHGAWTALARCVNAWDDLRAGHKTVPWPLDHSPARGER
ncbi:hypothetical protein [Nocardia salmonicida]|uniref:hypothetical protein n=1 Tax=Nocardia salmonicida TaxID=53431 RepID=UPI00379845A1